MKLHYSPKEHATAIVLFGGGARAACQVAMAVTGSNYITGEHIVVIDVGEPQQKVVPSHGQHGYPPHWAHSAPNPDSASLASSCKTRGWCAIRVATLGPLILRA